MGERCWLFLRAFGGGDRYQTATLQATAGFGAAQIRRAATGGTGSGMPWGWAGQGGLERRPWPRGDAVALCVTRHHHPTERRVGGHSFNLREKRTFLASSSTTPEILEF